MAYSEFLKEYLFRGMTEIFVTDYEHKEERSGYQDEYTNETVVAKHNGGFVSCSVSLEQKFNPYRPSRDLTVGDLRPISEAAYLAAIKGNQRVDTPEALAELERENHVRLEKQKAQKALDDSAPTCPSHGKLVLRQNSKTKQFFWGCKKYPDCRTTNQFTAQHRRLRDELLKIH